MAESLPKVLYKYRGGAFERDLKALTENFIWAASPETLNDPFEVTVVVGRDEFISLDLLTQSIQQLRPKRKLPWEPKYNSFLETVVDFVEGAKRWGIFSLAQTPLDELSWAHYASSHLGFCVEYNVERLLEQTLRQELVFRVEYKTKPPVIGPAIVLGSADSGVGRLTRDLLATKSTHWQHEGEWRVVSGSPGPKAYDYRAVTGIYFGYRMPEVEKLALMTKLQGRGISYYQVRLVANAYELKAEAVPDPFQNAPQYLGAVAPVEPGVPFVDEYLSEHEGYVELIEKAIEIVRREPYCFKVTSAYVSGSRGTPEDPVFYVTCDGPNGLPKNFWLSRTEIEEQFEKIEASGR